MEQGASIFPSRDSNSAADLQSHSRHKSGLNNRGPLVAKLGDLC